MLSLSFNEVEALLGAIVDCDPDLHAKLEKYVAEQKEIVYRHERAQLLFVLAKHNIISQLTSYKDFKNYNYSSIDIAIDKDSHAYILKFKALFNTTVSECFYNISTNHLTIIQ